MARQAYRYIGGDHEFLQGVPRVDLSADEVEALSAEQRAILDANLAGPAPLYEVVRGAKVSQPSKAVSEPRRGAGGQGEAL
jgi:hypothetical protein